MFRRKISSTSASKIRPEIDKNGVENASSDVAFVVDAFATQTLTVKTSASTSALASEATAGHRPTLMSKTTILSPLYR